MATVGAELSEMDRLAQTFVQQSERAVEIRALVDAAVAGTTWTGPAADKFRSEWGQFAPTLARLHESLGEAGQAVRQRRAAIAAATA
jgi:WXG100 family type VII secretion target